MIRWRGWCWWCWVWRWFRSTRSRLESHIGNGRLLVLVIVIPAFRCPLCCWWRWHGILRMCVGMSRGNIRGWLRRILCGW